MNDYNEEVMINTTHIKE
jgi:hypothetical protein